MINVESSLVAKRSYFPWRQVISGSGEIVQSSRTISAEILLKDALDREQILIGQIAAMKRQKYFSHEILHGGEEAARTLATLTKRQKEVLRLILAGKSNKIVAFDTGINQRTVENHRAAIMRKTGVASITALTRLVMAADLVTALDG